MSTRSQRNLGNTKRTQSTPKFSFDPARERSSREIGRSFRNVSEISIVGIKSSLLSLSLH